MPEIAEEWLRCPRCKSAFFTMSATPYGIELACSNCPTYLGARLPLAARRGRRPRVRIWRTRGQHAA